MRDDMVPVWVEDQCALCYGCINGCPAQAIQYGKGTEKHGRYMNPRVELPAPEPELYMDLDADEEEFDEAAEYEAELPEEEAYEALPESSEEPEETEA